MEDTGRMVFHPLRATRPLISFPDIGSCPMKLHAGSWIRMMLKDVVEGFVLGFLGLALIHGLSDCMARRSFSWTVPYFCSLAGHLLASARWLCSTLVLERQF